jgi:hypothetical protein
MEQERGRRGICQCGAAICKGGHYVEREIAAELAVAKFSQTNPLDRLTTREIDILRLLGQGKKLCTNCGGRELPRALLNFAERALP